MANTRTVIVDVAACGLGLFSLAAADRVLARFGGRAVAVAEKQLGGFLFVAELPVGLGDFARDESTDSSLFVEREA